MKSYAKRGSAGRDERGSPAAAQDTATFGGLPEILNQSPRVQAQLKLDRSLNSEVSPLQRMFSGEDEQGSFRKEGDKDVDNAREQLKQLGLGVDQYTLVGNEQDGYSGGTGNCHGYSLFGDPDRFELISWPTSFLESYKENADDKAVTVFTNSTSVEHSAAGHDDACVHKLAMDGEWGPLYRASAGSMNYDDHYKFPEGIDRFRLLIDQFQQTRLQEEMRTTFYTFLESRGIQDDEAWDFANQDHSEEAILAKVKELTGETYTTGQAFLDALKQSDSDSEE